MENAHEDVTDSSVIEQMNENRQCASKTCQNPRTRLKSVSDASHESGMSAVK